MKESNSYDWNLFFLFRYRRRIDIFQLFFQQLSFLFLLLHDLHFYSIQTKFFTPHFNRSLLFIV